MQDKACCGRRRGGGGTLHWFLLFVFTIHSIWCATERVSERQDIGEQKRSLRRFESLNQFFWVKQAKEEGKQRKSKRKKKKTTLIRRSIQWLITSASEKHVDDFVSKKLHREHLPVKDREAQKAEDILTHCALLSQRGHCNMAHTTHWKHKTYSHPHVLRNCVLFSSLYNGKKQKGWSDIRAGFTASINLLKNRIFEQTLQCQTSEPAPGVHSCPAANYLSYQASNQVCSQLYDSCAFHCPLHREI